MTINAPLGYCLSLAPQVNLNVFPFDWSLHATGKAMLAWEINRDICMAVNCSKINHVVPLLNLFPSVCWSPKGKQVAVGKMNATVSQYTPVSSLPYVWVGTCHPQLSRGNVFKKNKKNTWLAVYLNSIFIKTGAPRKESCPMSKLLLLRQPCERYEPHLLRCTPYLHTHHY